MPLMTRFCEWHHSMPWLQSDGIIGERSSAYDSLRLKKQVRSGLVQVEAGKMTITITLPNEIELPLQRKAEAEHRSVEEVALAILATALEADQAFPTPQQVVAK